MKAIVCNRYGSPDVLELAEIDKPVVGDDEVLVRVHAAAVNPADWHVMRGLPYVARMIFGLRKPRPAVLASDIAGQVEAVGKNATRFGPGDEVFGRTRTSHRPDRPAAVDTGGCAEYACVSGGLAGAETGQRAWSGLHPVRAEAKRRRHLEMTGLTGAPPRTLSISSAGWGTGEGWCDTCTGFARWASPRAPSGSGPPGWGGRARGWRCRWAGHLSHCCPRRTECGRPAPRPARSEWGRDHDRAARACRRGC